GLPNAGGHYDEEFHAEGAILRWPGPMFGVSPDSAGDVSFAAGELCLRSGWRGAPWAATTVYTVGRIVVARTDNGHAFQATAVGSAPHQSGGSEPSGNTGSGATTSDGDITWTEIGASSHHGLFGPPD